jgi:hypothetical protein
MSKASDYSKAVQEKPVILFENDWGAEVTRNGELFVTANLLSAD